METKPVAPRVPASRSAPYEARKSLTVAIVLTASSLLFSTEGANAQAQSSSTPQKVPAELTAAKVTKPGWKSPRTSWGHPSLEGIWTSDDMKSVPKDRPKEFGMRQSLTPKEFAARLVQDSNLRADSASARNDIVGYTEAGVRTFGYTSLIIDPPDGQTPSLTPWALARQTQGDMGTYGPGPFDDFSDLILFERCITRGILGSTIPTYYGSGMRIVQSPNEVAISYEMVHDTRVIPLDGRPFVNDRIRQYLGNSRAHWEGDTLVVETRNLTDKTSVDGVNGKGTRHSASMVIKERLTRVDPDMIEYVVTVDDPVAYKAPFTIRMMYTTQPGYEIYEYACHEDNQTVSLALGGERAYEKQVAAARAAGKPIPKRVPGGFYFDGTAGKINANPGRDSGNDQAILPDSDDKFFDVSKGE